VPSVALARPLWWLALRSLRFMIALVVLALGAGSGPVPPPARPAPAAQSPVTLTVAQSPTALTVAQSPTALTIAQDPATAPGRDLRAPGAAATDEGAGAKSTRDYGTLAHQAGLPPEASLRPVASLPPAPVRRPHTDAFLWAFGQRAPPQV
jgi:hypothetical protein